MCRSNLFEDKDYMRHKIFVKSDPTLIDITIAQNIFVQEMGTKLLAPIRNNKNETQGDSTVGWLWSSNSINCPVW